MAIGGFLLFQPACDATWYQFIQPLRHSWLRLARRPAPDLLDYLGRGAIPVMSRTTGTGPGAVRRLAAWRTGWILAAIVAVAAGLRGYELGRLSFWYDEVVTMRLARAGSPAALIERLFRIDATRAPLHPLLLEGWVGVFGVSEAAARAFSVLCGVLTVLLVFDIGRVAFDRRTGLWAAWLAALSPVLIVYSREARMYAWLVLVTCLCWRLLLGLRNSFTTARAVAYVLSLAALVYSHPLGLPMLATLALAGLLGLRDCFGSWRRWLAVHLAAAALVAPWVHYYLDHPPEFVSGPLPLRFLLGTPIGFIGGNFAVLAGLVVLIAWGIVRGTGRDDQCQHRRVPLLLLLWLIVPPLALYVYSRLFQPIFGPQRYTVYSAPAYLVLVALGLNRLPAVLRYPLAIVLSILAGVGAGAEGVRPGAQGRLARIRRRDRRTTGRLDAGDRGADERGPECRGRDGPVLPAQRLRGDRAG